jgi:hypothetical protein
MAGDEAYIPIHSNGDDISQTPNMKLIDVLGTFYNSLFKIQEVSANHNAASGEMIYMTTGATGKDIVLPAVVAGKTIVVFATKADNGAGAVTVKCTGEDLIEGNTTDTLSAQFDKQKYISVNGTDYLKW